MAGGQPADPAADGDNGADDEGGAEGETDESMPDQAAEAGADAREARPELFEHAFGAQAHPAEAAVSEPSPQQAAAPAALEAQGEPSEPEQPQVNPAATPEQ